MSKKYGILAHPAKHSLSGVMQNAAFKAVGIDAQYGLFDIPVEGLDEFMDYVKHEPIYGLSVSFPHKGNVMKYMNEIHEDAQKIGAVNTVVNKGGFLYGYNTDFTGSNKALEEVVGRLKGKKVAVLGAGGAARAVAYGLLKEGAEVSIYNRSKPNAKELADYFSGLFGVEVVAGTLDEMAEIEHGDILIQTTSIWMTPDEAKLEDLIPESVVAKFDVMEDIVYVPLKTPLIKAAERLKKTVITGDKMLLYQGMEQFKLWTKKEAPVKVMRTELEDNLV